MSSLLSLSLFGSLTYVSFPTRSVFLFDFSKMLTSASQPCPLPCCFKGRGLETRQEPRLPHRVSVTVAGDARRVGRAALCGAGGLSCNPAQF